MHMNFCCCDVWNVWTSLHLTIHHFEYFSFTSCRSFFICYIHIRLSNKYINLSFFSLTVSQILSMYSITVLQTKQKIKYDLSLPHSVVHFSSSELFWRTNLEYSACHCSTIRHSECVLCKNNRNRLLFKCFGIIIELRFCRRRRKMKQPNYPTKIICIHGSFH